MNVLSETFHKPIKFPEVPMTEWRHILGNMVQYIVKITLKTNITIPAQAADEVLRIISKLLTTIIHIPH